VYLHAEGSRIQQANLVSRIEFASTLFDP